MKNKKIVIALGGNALGENAKEQLELVKKTAIPIVDLIEAGSNVVIAHGNGPQVGMINLAFDGDMPFAECCAMSQGYIGFHLQNSLKQELLKRNIKKDVSTLITQVLVDKDDKAFLNPTKPVGKFYTKEEAKSIEKEKNFKMIEDSGRGYRRLVPSPLPMDVIEKNTVRNLIDRGEVVITVGGGGIPVINKDGLLEGISAVIDKDFASAKLAELIDADYLIVLTAVEKVALNYGKENEIWLEDVSVEKMKEYIKQDHFAPGSMLPKVEACINFASSMKGRKALITSLEKAKEGISGLTGTRISL